MAHKRDCAAKAGCQYWPRYVTTLVQTLYARGMAHKRDCAAKAGCQYWPRYVTTLYRDYAQEGWPTREIVLLKLDASIGPGT